MTSYINSMLGKPVLSLEEANKKLTEPGAIHETVTQVVDGLVYKVYKDQPPTLRDLWINVSKAYADRTYIVYGDERYTYAQINSKVVALANALKTKYGVEKGDRISIVMRNLPEYIIAFWAVESLGAVSTCVNAWLPEEPMAFCIKNTQSKVAIVDQERFDRVYRRFGELQNEGLARIILARPASNFTIPANVVTFDSVLDDFSGYSAIPDVKVLPEDNGTIFFTSGTTSLPKGVLTTNRQYISNLKNASVGGARHSLRMSGEVVAPGPNDPQKASLVTVPFFHVTANQSNLLTQTAAGSKLVLMYKWDVKEAVRLIRKEEITSTGGVPTMVVQLSQSELKDDPDCTLEGFGYGGAPSPENLARDASKSFKKAVASQAYGLTETNSVAVSFAGYDFLQRPTSAGLPSPINEVMIVDPDTETEVPRNSLGEVWIRGINVAKAYWNNPEATRKAFTDDHWFRSGDIGYMDDEGFIYIKDRAKDIIIRGGENIASVTVENALYQDERIMDCAVVPVKHDVLGEEVGAIVSVRPEFIGKVTEAELQAVAAKRLAKHEVPVCIDIRNEPIVRSATGKIVKRELKIELNEIWQRRKKEAASGGSKSKL